MDTAIDIALKFAAITVAFVCAADRRLHGLAERRVLGFIQGGLVQIASATAAPATFADLLKFILKEDIVPDKSTRFIYFLAPVIATMAALMTMIVYPFGPRSGFRSRHHDPLVIRASTSDCFTCSASLRSVSTASCSRAGRQQQVQLDGRSAFVGQMISYELALG
jgi:NADH-quinone oxidoreductase subunit H